MNARLVNWMYVAIFAANYLVYKALIYYLTHVGAIGLIPMSMVSELIFIIPSFAFVIVTRTKPRDLFKFRRIKISTVLMTVLFTFLCMPLVSVVNLASQFFVENAVQANSTTFLMMPFSATFLIIAVYAPVCEELIFRGITYESLRRGRNVFQAMYLSAIFFGLAHMNFNQAAYALLLGIILVMLREATGSLWATILMHFLFNAWNVLLMYASVWLAEAFPDLMGESEAVYQTTAQRNAFLAEAIGAYLVIAAVTTALAACVLAWIAKNEGRKEDLRNIWKRRKEGKGRVLTPSFLLVLVLFLGKMLYDVLA